MLIVETNKMFTVNRQKGTLLANRKCEDIFIWECDPCASAFVGRQDIVTELAEFYNYGQWEILIRRAVSSFGRFILQDVLLDLISMRSGVRPSIGQVFRTQGGIAPEQIGFGGSKMSRLHEHPNGNACAHNPSFAAQDIEGALDARIRICKVADDPLEDLRFFGARKLGENLLNILKGTHQPPLFPIMIVDLVPSLYHGIGLRGW